MRDGKLRSHWPKNIHQTDWSYVYIHLIETFSSDSITDLYLSVYTIRLYLYNLSVDDDQWSYT